MTTTVKSSRRSPQKRAFQTGLVVYLWLMTFVILFPVLFGLLGAFQTPAALSQGVVGFLTNPPTFDNFARAFRAAPLFDQLINTVIVTIAETVLVLVTSILFAYALVFSKMRGKTWLFIFVMITLMIPAEGIIVANYLTITQMGLFDTIVAIFLPMIASGTAIFLFRQAFLTFPRQIHESATLDGVGPLRFMWSFLIPLNLPTVFAVTVTTAIGAWNNYMWPLLITKSPENRTVQVGLTQLADESATDTGAVLAGLFVVTIPMILLVLSSRKFLAKGLTQGSEK
ncbi:MAG: carbohydrate ABC transporter permease [Corynebacterium sp.]|uniref:carbohydrate ABC transporter permease n=1 Tax=Corynebacterium sp. TaxID=1720 RepID=UPI0026DF6DF0|nr:carbohydrate ABC transporter permease [Corynebacterium sp.]MDO5670192.1 carbohydrate ABC transporter permease [Corynebacterium sp.]